MKKELKKVRVWLNILPRPVRHYYIQNMFKQWGENETHRRLECECKVSELMSSSIGFLWAKSKQGYTFWFRIHDEIINNQ